MRRIQRGSQLRKLRLERGITLQRAGHSARVSETKMSRMELGRVSFKRRDVENLLTLYGITDEQARTAILSLAEEANTPGWWQQYSEVFPGWSSTYLRLEGAASLIRAYEVAGSTHRGRVRQRWSAGWHCVWSARTPSLQMMPANCTSSSMNRRCGVPTATMR